MKFCLAFMMQNEADWLRLHLPVWLKSSAIDGIVAIDGGSSDDSAEYVRSMGGQVADRPWDWKPCDQENAVIRMAEWLGYDCILLTAPDELWWPKHIDQMKRMMESGAHRALRFPTFNFVRDRQHYAIHSPFFPDFHIRVWRLGQGVRHIGVLDSVPNINPEQATMCAHMPMYHYSWIKPRDRHMLKQVNFHRVRDGLEPLPALPETVEIEDFPASVPFVLVQPLDPHVIGVRAPYV